MGLHIEDTLKKEKYYISTTQGYSMWPMLKNRQDTIIVKPVSRRLHRFEVALFKRKKQYVLHRVVEVLPDGYLIRGDNCLEKEYVSEQQILGVLISFYRKDKKINMNGWKYRFFVGAWMFLHPIWRGWLRTKKILRPMVGWIRNRKTKKVQSQTISKEAGLYLAGLIQKGLHGEKVKDLPKTCKLSQVYQLAKSNDVLAVAYEGLGDNLLAALPESIVREWKSACDNTLYREVSFDLEREGILSALEEEGLSYLPLKGILIKNYYPKPGLRFMSDNDILYGEVEEMPGGGYQLKEGSKKESQEKMIKIMKNLGYEVKSLVSNDESFVKEPHYNFEMHNALFSESHKVYKHFKNSWEHAILDEGSKYAYHFSDEEEYVYFLAHAYKHFDRTGCGIRTIVDIYVILQAKGKMDEEYLNRRLQETGLLDFRRKMERLARHAFGKDEGEMTQEDLEVYAYMLGSGTFGNVGNLVGNRLNELKEEGWDARWSRLIYIKERIFLDEKTIRGNYPYFDKHKWAKVFLPAYRVIRGVQIHPRLLLEEFKKVTRK